MISRTSLNERTREWGLREDVIEKDYVLGWLLWGIGSNRQLSDSWAFKGGTCLKKCYLETYRFSEDLDFTVLPGGPLQPDEIMPLLPDIFQKIYEQSGIVFNERPPMFHIRPDGKSVEGRMYYRGPRNTPALARIKLDLTRAEQVIQPAVLRHISHPYPDRLPEPATVRCYSFEELFAEKLRAMGERSRPRDLYDIVNLFRRQDVRAHSGLVYEVYVQKCKTKGVEVFTSASIETSPFREELKTEWANMLGHQLLALPPFENYWDEIPQLYRWLEGKLSIETMPVIPIAKNEISEWAPPPTIWVWGQGINIESIRFATANNLCVELGYGGNKVLVEPYSLRRTNNGSLVLYADQSETKELQLYNVDQIESIEVTNIPYKPRYVIE